MNEIEPIIGEFKPHIFGISESNFKIGHDKSDISIDDYNIFFSHTLQNPQLHHQPDKVLK